MTKSMTKTEAFARYGAKATNAQWSWSARAKNAVVLTMWSDKFDWDSKPLTYDGSYEKGDEDQLGNKERLKDLLWARDQCEGRVAVVILKAGQPENGRRTIQDCFTREE